MHFFEDVCRTDGRDDGSEDYELDMKDEGEALYIHIRRIGRTP